MNLRSWYLERPIRPITVACRDFLSRALRQRAEARERDGKALRDSEARYRRLAEMSPDGILVHTDGIIVYANPGLARVLGADSPDDLIGRQSLDFVVPEQRGEVREHRRKLNAGEFVGLAESRFLRLDGSETHVERVASAITWGNRPSFLVIVRDINARRQAENELREREQYIEGLLSHIAEAVVTIGETGEIETFNPSAERMFGYTAEDAVGRNVALLMPEPDRGRHDGYLMNYLHTGTGKIIGIGPREVMAQRKDGAVFPMEITVGEMAAGGGRAFIGAIRDITERKQVEKKLRDSEARYRDLIEGADLGIQIASEERGRIYANRACVELFGYESPEDLFSAPHWGLVAEYDRDRVKEYREAVFNGDTSVRTYEMDGVRKDGSNVPLQVFLRRIVWEGEDAIQRTFIDLTERKQAERALRDSEARYRDLIEGSDLGIQIGSREMGRLFTNQACAKLFGYDSIEEILAVPRQGIVAVYDRERLTGYREALFDGDSSVRTYEMDGVRKDGSIVPLQVFLRRIVWEGEDAIQRTFIDLTDRKKAEEQLRQAQKMEVVGQLTGGLAHDFNNLLTIILGNLELLDRKLEDRKLQGLAQTAINASRRGAELTQRLLAFSRKQTLEPEIIDVNALLAGTAELMARSLGETIAIEVQGGEDLWLCEIDPAQLENAILNLAINARDAMPDGGRLTIATANVNIDAVYAAAQRDDVSPGDYVLVSVADTGSGMPREVVEHACEPFFTTKGVGEGSGLGLSMVYGFVRQSRGHVAIASTPGAGTEVKLYLPKSAATRQPAQDAADDGAPVSRGETILVVEDDEEVRALSVRMLADLGYDIVEAADGRQAIEVLENNSAIDLLFTDVVLPGGMSGADVAVEAARRMPGIKVLYVSGYANNVLTSQGRLDPGVQFLNKPYRRSELAKKVCAALGGAAA